MGLSAFNRMRERQTKEAAKQQGKEIVENLVEDVETEDKPKAKRGRPTADKE